MIFVDSNVPMYMVGNDLDRKIDVQRVLERLASEQRHLATSSEVFQELLHRYVSAGRRDAIQPVFDVLRELVDDVFAVEEADVLVAKDLVQAHTRLSARDAVHAAVMRRRNISEILSFDRGFDEVAGIKRLPLSLPRS
ncbi:MAG TPA: type II toxin-antitoxin system VapC family toxin [Solirubrobacteraceae bacterium]|nr:type II toxin-antitoxin system VapC family toxin [Solirubrobacteraceae bacterium]